MESHLLDGLLGRSALFFSLSLLVYPLLERKFCFFSESRSENFERVRRLSLWSLALGFFGLMVCLGAVVLSASEVQVENDSLFRFDFEILRQWTWPVISQTQFGKTWTGYLISFAIAVGARWRESRRGAFFSDPVQVLWGGLLLMLFSRLGHAGTLEIFSPWWGLHIVHMGAVLLWVVGLGVCAFFLFSEKDGEVSMDFSNFGTFMRSTLLLVVLTGGGRSLLHWSAKYQAFREPYIWILMFKFVLVVGMCIFAFKLRNKRRLHSRKAAIEVLSFEVTVAAMVIFLSVLLSQLPPP